MRIAIDRQFERAEMAFGGTDRAFHDREVGDARRRHIGRRPDQHRDVEMVLQQVRRLDRLLVAAVNEDHAFAGEAHEGDLGCRLGGGREQRRHFRARGAGVSGPAGGFTDVGVSDVAGAVRDFGEQRGFLGAADDQRLAGRRRRTKSLELGTAELARGQDLGAATAARHRRAIERHRVFARADHESCRPIGHWVSRIWAN